MNINFLSIFKTHISLKLTSTGGNFDYFRMRGSLMFAFKVFLGLNVQDLYSFYYYL